MKIGSKYNRPPTSDLRSKRLFLFYLKIFILLSPLPFGCVGKVWSPLFYLVLVIVTFLGLKVSEDQSELLEAERYKSDLRPPTSAEKSYAKISNKDHISTNTNTITNTKAEAGGDRQGAIGDILYGKWIKISFGAFLLFILLQIVPLPIFLVRIISPKKIEILNQLLERLPAFTSLSLVSLETLIFGLVVLAYAGFSWTLFRLSLKRKEMVSLIHILIISAALQTVLGLFKYARGNRYFFLFFYPLKKIESSHFLTGTLGNANHFAFYLEMAFPLILALILVRFRVFDQEWTFKERLLSLMEENRRVLLYLVSLFLVGLGIYLTGSRSGIVALVLSILIFLAFSFLIKASEIRKRMAWVMVPLLVLVILWGGQDTANKFISLKQKVEVGRGIGRFQRWPATLEMARDFPFFGTGFGTYRYSYFLYDREFGQWITHAHSDVLEIIGEGGIIGSFIFFSLLGLIFISQARTWWIRKRTEIKLIGLGLLSGLFAASFHSFFDFSLRIPSNMFVFVLILVLGIKIVNYKKV